VRKHHLAVLATVTAAGLFGFAAPAQAEEPTEESRTVVTNLVNRADHGPSNPSETWALDTFTRTVEIVGGPGYVHRTYPSAPAVAEVAEPEVPANIDEQVARAPRFEDVCDLVKKYSLRWKYHAKVSDKGTFITQAGDELSPRAGVALLGDVPGTMTGGFTADFTAPAHWCSFNPSRLDGKTLDGTDAPGSSEWLKCLFGDLKGSPQNRDWSWTYKTCTEQWIDAADNNDGQDEEAGDITGKPCPTATPAPTTAPPVVVVAAQLPVTGASVTSPAVLGGALVVVGAALLVGLAVTRRRRA
jgi:hypothetical protein